MKKITKIMAFATALVAFGFAFTSCDDKDDSEEKDDSIVLNFEKVEEKSNEDYDFYLTDAIDMDLFGEDVEETRSEIPEVSLDDFMPETKFYVELGKSRFQAPRSTAPESEEYWFEFGVYMDVPDFSDIFGDIIGEIQPLEEVGDGELNEVNPVQDIMMPAFIGHYTVADGVYTLNVEAVNIALGESDESDESLDSDAFQYAEPNFVDVDVKNWKSFKITKNKFTIVLTDDDPLGAVMSGFDEDDSVNE